MYQPIRYLFLFLLFGASQFSIAQEHTLDNLRKQLNNAAKEDTFRVQALCSMADYYGFVQFDSCLYYATQALNLSDKLNYEFGRFLCYKSKFFAFNCKGNFPEALQQALNWDRDCEQLKKEGRSLGGLHYFVGFLYLEMSDYPTAINIFHQTLQATKEDGGSMSESFFIYSQMAMAYLALNRMDSALWYAQQGYDLGLNSKIFKKFFSLAICNLGIIHAALHHYSQAENLFHYGIKQSGQFNNIYFQARNYYNLASLFEEENVKDSAIYYGGIALQLCREHNFAEFTLNAGKLLTSVYDSEKKGDSTLKYMRIELAARDSVFSQSKVQQFRQTAFDEVQRQQTINEDAERYQNKVRLYSLSAALIIFLLLAFILYRNSRQKQKAKSNIEKAYAELKSTQAQLIQSEKMASLGELTAGIAHEIQNPLNFVNNFSEVNNELIEELKAERSVLNVKEQEDLLNDIFQNNEKIFFHGKRADAIVKGMLQHSKQTSGVKELTDINALCDEYLRLSYHGLRAKDKSFNADFKTDLDKTIGKINIVPQDIGRVLLNLFNNAFYAVNEKKKRYEQSSMSFEPFISIQTKKISNKIEIKVNDNGNGIPQNIIDKIFQPFFTTKPTGLGTGLGLSLSYDIVKTHGGEIKVETKEGEGSEFVIRLPGG